MSASPRSVGFIGLGQMGFGMAANLLKAGHDVLAYDVAHAAAAASPRANNVVGATTSPTDWAGTVSIATGCLSLSKNTHLRELTPEEELFSRST